MDLYSDNVSVLELMPISSNMSRELLHKGFGKNDDDYIADKWNYLDASQGL